MLQLIAVIAKDLLLLRRDRAGLLVLFVMPAVLVTVVTLVQENALNTMGAGDIQMLLIDDDRQVLGRRIVEALTAADGVRLTRTLDGRPIDRRQALALVAKGTYQLCLVLPTGLTEGIRQRARQSALESLSADRSAPAPHPAPVIEVTFDPAVTGAFRSAVNNLLDLTVLRLEIAQKLAALARHLPEHINRALAKELEAAAQWMPQAPLLDLDLNWSETPLLNIAERRVQTGSRTELPTSIQHNVPAWALFGIFFIAVPMAGAFIRERDNGTQRRLLAMPVGYPVLLCGRIGAYVMVCVVQCVLIGCIGKWMLPLWGSPPLEMGASPLALGIVAASAILAATGYGILLGTVVKSYEQASMFGPTSIVIAAAIGGIMVPVYAMPAFMQTISMASPLAWGLNGVLDVFVRGGGVADVLPEAGALIAFFAACLLTAWYWRHRRILNGII